MKLMKFMQRVQFLRPYPENFVLRYFSEQYLIFALSVLYLFHLTQLHRTHRCMKEAARDKWGPSITVFTTSFTAYSKICFNDPQWCIFLFYLQLEYISTLISCFMYFVNFKIRRIIIIFSFISCPRVFYNTIAKTSNHQPFGN